MSNSNTPRPNYALPIAIMFALFFMIAFVTGYQNPLGDVIKNMTGGNVVLSQLGTFANFIAYAFMGYPAGKLLEKKGYRITALWAVTVGFAGVLVTYLSGFIAGNNLLAVSIYLCGALIAGFSMCMLNAVVNPMLNSLGKDQKQGNQLIQFGGVCNSTGATLAPMIVGGLIGGTASSIASANPVFFMSMGIFALAAAILYFSKLPEAEGFGTEQKKQEKLKIADALKFPNLRWGLVAIFCYVGIEVGIANWVFQYLNADASLAEANPGFTAAAIAGSVSGLYWLLMLVGRLVGGVIGSKVSARTMLAVTSAVCCLLIVAAICMSESAATFIGFNSANLEISTITIPVNAVLLVLCGLCTSVQWGSIFNLAVSGVGKYTAMASGLFMAMVCGGGIIPTVQGLFAGGNILASFWLPAALAAFLCLYAVVLSRTNKSSK